MSFDQALISRANGGGIFAAAWVAGTRSGALSKYYKSHDIEKVNVPKTCDILNLALRTEHQLQSQNSVKENEGIPFRICTSLFFGTLKIYQQQVNNLYRLSEDLVIKSSKYEVHEPATKGNKHRNNKSITKRRFTITHNNANINYSQMLDDLERLAEETDNNLDEDESAQNNVSMTQQCTNRQTLAQLQIREITIREINATYGIPELDDDCGFGEATNEDVIQFFTFSGTHDEHLSSFVKRTPTKRKSAYEDDPPAKQRRLCDEEHLISFGKQTLSKRKGAYEEIYVEKQSRLNHDTIIDKLRNEVTPIGTDFLTTPSHPSPCENNLYGEDETFADIMNLNQLKDNIKEEYNCDHALANIVEPNLSVAVKVTTSNESKITVKKEHDEMIQVDDVKTSKLIIDQCIKLMKVEMVGQFQKQHTPPRSITKDIFRKSKSKKRETAKNLLKRFNKRTSSFRCLRLKQKPLDVSIKFKQEYLHLVRDILKTDYKEELASEIYPKWETNIKTPQKQIKQTRLCKTPDKNTGPTIDCNLLNENDIIVDNDDGENNMCWENINVLEGLTCQTPQLNVDENEHLDNSFIYNEWRPYGVMTKLLQIWRYSTETKINATEFCHSARAQIDKALAFSSLLTLSKSRLIFITKRFNTIQMDMIILGIGAKNLMQIT